MNTAPPKTDTRALTHNPFAGLASRPEGVAHPAKPGSSPTVIRLPPVKPLPPCKVSVRLESTGRSGKVVTRIRGLPVDNLAAIASRLQKALGCGATVDANDVLLLGSLVERTSQWLDCAGDLRTTAPESTAPEAPKPSNTAAPATGTQRCDVRRGQRVAIVMKADQSSGALTEGVVRELLTSSATHPRGIKVRLESGEVGRVKIVFG